MIIPAMDSDPDSMKYAKKCLMKHEEIFGIKGLSTSVAALRLVLYFVNNVDRSFAEDLIERKSGEIASALSDIGMKFDPRQFGEDAAASTRPQSRDMAPLHSKEIRDPGIRLALDCLTQAARILELPHDFFVKRKDLSCSDMTERSGPIADSRPVSVVDPTFRPPTIESYHKRPHLLSDAQAKKLWTLTELSCLDDNSDRENRDFGKGSTRSPSRAAVRQLAREIGLDSHYLKSDIAMEKPFATFRDVLLLVRLEIQTNHIAQTLKNALTKN